MLKRLRVKFICINMLIVTAMLCVIFGMIYHFTRQNLESESFRTMQTLAAEPLRRGRPDPWPGEVRLPYLVLEIGPAGRLTAAGGGYYDLSDEGFLREITDAALEMKEPTGILKEYDLRYQRVVTPVAQRIVFVDTSGERSTLGHLIETFAVIGAAGVLGFFRISLFLARWAVKPVERAWTEQRQFVADASHELKTPLTVFLTNAELLQEQGGDEVFRARFSGSILSMANQMRGLVESLLDNAMKYSSAPAAVRVALKRHGLHCLLSVSNPGAPIPPEELKKIFQRFYRTDKVRSMNRSYGLGLSIAERIVKQHKGKIWAESNGGYNTFYVELPLISGNTAQ